MLKTNRKKFSANFFGFLSQSSHRIGIFTFVVVVIVVVIVWMFQAVPHTRNDYDHDNDNRPASAGLTTT